MAMSKKKRRPDRKANLARMGWVKLPPSESVTIAAAPSFSCTLGQPSLATIYGDHYDRLYAIVVAARSGNKILIALALEHQDKHGSSAAEFGKD